MKERKKEHATFSDVHQGKVSPGSCFFSPLQRRTLEDEEEFGVIIPSTWSRCVQSINLVDFLNNFHQQHDYYITEEEGKEEGGEEKVEDMI